MVDTILVLYSVRNISIFNDFSKFGSNVVTFYYLYSIITHFYHIFDVTFGKNLLYSDTRLYVSVFECRLLNETARTYTVLGFQQNYCEDMHICIVFNIKTVKYSHLPGL